MTPVVSIAAPPELAPAVSTATPEIPPVVSTETRSPIPSVVSTGASRSEGEWRHLLSTVCRLLDERRSLRSALRASVETTGNGLMRFASRRPTVRLPWNNRRGRNLPARRPSRSGCSGPRFERKRKVPHSVHRAGVPPPEMTILLGFAHLRRCRKRCHPERSEGPLIHMR